MAGKALGVIGFDDPYQGLSASNIANHALAGSAKAHQKDVDARWTLKIGGNSVCCGAVEHYAAMASALPSAP